MPGIYLVHLRAPGKKEILLVPRRSLYALLRDKPLLADRGVRDKGRTKGVFHFYNELEESDILTKAWAAPSERTAHAGSGSSKGESLECTNMVSPPPPIPVPKTRD